MTLPADSVVNDGPTSTLRSCASSCALSYASSCASAPEKNGFRLYGEKTNTTLIGARAFRLRSTRFV
jgi:hypothetical protein